MVAALAVFALNGCGNSLAKSPQVRAIRDRGVLRVGVMIDVPRFSYIKPGEAKPEGFEVDIARHIAKEILGDENRIRFIYITLQFRGPVLDNDQADIVIANFSITEERKKVYNFTSSYYTDTVGLLVRRGSGINTIADMNGRIAGVNRTATSQSAFQTEADRLGITVKFEQFANHPEIKAALLAGEVDAFVNDRMILGGYLDDRTVMLNEGFGPQPLGIASRLSNDELAAYLEMIVTSLRKDGGLDELARKWGV